MSVTDWLLEVEVAGRTLRYATQARTVAGAIYRPGLLGDLDLAEGAEAAEIEVVSRDLQVLADDLDGGTATLSYLEEDEVTAYVSGPITDPASGAPDEGVAFTITRDLPGVTLGTQVPSVTARVDATTWPVTVGHQIGSDGLAYPVIFGYPGYTGAATPECVVPAPLAQWLTLTQATSYVIVADDVDANVSSVRVKNTETLAETAQATVVVSDLLGQRVRAANFLAGGLPGSPQYLLFVGYSPSGGGGAARSLYDVIAYLLRRFAPESIDWARLPQVRTVLEPFLVDSWVDAPVSDPWVLIEGWLRDLSVEVRSGKKGRYFVARRYTADPARIVGSIIAGADARRASPYRRAGQPQNEVSVRCQQHPEQGWLYSVVACGSRRDVQPAGVNLGTSVIETALARRSWAKYGRRAGVGIDLDWVWDTGTALAVAERVLERTALPATLVEYRLRPSLARGIREGDDVLLTDPERPWVEVPAIVDEPPSRTLDAVTLRLRVPQ